MSTLPYSSSRSLPQYRALMVVDAKDFTGNPSLLHGGIATEIPELVEEAFHREHLDEIWRHHWPLGHTGDGVALGFDSEHLPSLLHPFLWGLQQVLAERNRKSGRHDALIRLRVSVHVGPISDSGRDELGDGNGKARNDTHRLLDSVPVKAILAAASEEVTHVAAIISDRVFQDVVVGGYSARHPDHFLRVSASVPGKNFQEDAWLYVPEPSGNLLRTDVLGERIVSAVQGDIAQTSPALSIGTSNGPAAVHVAGDQIQNAGGDRSVHTHGQGNVNVHHGLGNQQTGDQAFGDQTGGER